MEIVLFHQAFFSDVSDTIQDFYNLAHNQKRYKLFKFDVNLNGESEDLLNVLAFRI